MTTSQDSASVWQDTVATDARKSVRLAPMDPSAPSTVTVRMGQSVTTSMERVCVIQDSKGLTARTGSVHQAYTVSSVTNTAPVTPPTLSAATP